MKCCLSITSISRIRKKGYRENFIRIKKRLGGVGFETCQNKLADALTLQSRGDTSGHLGWIEYLLADYYDPMYTYQLNQKAERIVFRGEVAGIRDYLADARAKRGS